ncbi:MAG: hypothetical protein MUF51_04225 [Vicinamibacteria bacterium]|nr:hypothetical protein [Vicinamibacteria bacterium]
MIAGRRYRLRVDARDEQGRIRELSILGCIAELRSSGRSTLIFRRGAFEPLAIL